MNNTLILGLGSEILTDDGIGLRLVNDLEEILTLHVKENLKGRIDFKTCLTGSLDLLEIIKGYNSLIILDAIRTQSGTPGDVNRFSLNKYRDTIHLQNIHDISFEDTLKLGKSIGLKIPEKVNIITIEIFDNLTFGLNLSIELENRYSEIIKKINIQIEDILTPFSNVIIKR